MKIENSFNSKLSTLNSQKRLPRRFAPQGDSGKRGVMTEDRVAKRFFVAMLLRMTEEGYAMQRKSGAMTEEGTAE